MAAWATGEQGGADVALLVDWENLKWGLRQQYGVVPNISSLVAAAREYGRLVLARAYGDWTQGGLREDAPNLYRAGIEPIYAPGRNPVSGATLKNSADIRLVVDAVEMCGRLRHVGTYILVTGDADLIHALNFLRLQGRRVVVVAVAAALSALLSAAADAILLYDRDIEPLGRDERLPTGRDDAPPIERAIGWIVDLLREQSDGACPFTKLGSDLKQRHGFDARGWYGIPFKKVMLLAERDGRVHLSTSGGMDYASLPGIAAPLLDAPTPMSDAAERERAIETTSVTGFDSLSEDEWHDFLSFLRELQTDAPYMTARFIVERAAYQSVLPRLAREQLTSLVGDLTRRAILRGKQSEEQAKIGTTPSFPTLVVNEAAPQVREASGTEQLPSTRMPATTATTDPFNLLVPSLAEVRESTGIAYFPRVQQVLERRLGASVREFGFSSLSLFFKQAEEHGLVRIGWHNGAHILVARDDESKAVTSAEIPPSPATTALGKKGVRLALRVIATIEDRAQAPLQTGSLAHFLHGTLIKEGISNFSLKQANRLIKQEFVVKGYMLARQVAGTDPQTGVPRLLENYHLDRKHPSVKAAIADGPIALIKGDLKMLLVAPTTSEASERKGAANK